MKKRSIMKSLFLAIWGLVALFSSLNKPGVAALRGHEILGLIGSGMCFGVALVELFGWFRVRGE